MKKLLAAVLGGMLMASLLAAVLPQPAQAAPTRTQLLNRAKVLNFDYSLARFIKVYNGTKKGVDRSFAWKNYDGCSVDQVPQPVRATLTVWKSTFRKACLRHDFGYRNFGNGLALGSSQSYKDRIDSQLRADMKTLCRNKYGVGAKRTACYGGAEEYYAGVKNFGQAQTAFFKGKCTSGRLCLFDDDGYADRRVALDSSVSKLGDSPYKFNDKTSSVINNSSRAWVIYDDSGYGDRRFCIPPGVSVRNLGVDAYKFNDKTSAAKRMSGRSCPSGTPVIQKG